MTGILAFLLLLCITLLPPISMVHLDLSNEVMNTKSYWKDKSAVVKKVKNYDVLATNGVVHSKRSKTRLNDDTCQKTWMYGSNGTCQCGSSVHGYVSCSNISNQVAILRCHCMTYDSTIDVVLGSCPYGCGYFNDSSSWSGGEIYHLLPLNTTDLNHGMCGRLNRDYRLCSRCIEGFSPLVYSYDLHCVKCNDKYNWLKYVAIAYIPLTVFYLIVILFRINATEPYLYGFITLNQGLASPTNLRAIFITVTGGSALALRLIAIPYTIWNLDFVRSLSLNICLDLTTLQTLALDYAIAIYPLLLVLVTYVAIELHDRGCRVLIWLWRPFHRCCVQFTRMMDIKSSIIKAFATFLLLSYVKFINTTVDMLLPVKVYNSSGKPVGWYVYYDTSYKYFGPKHLPFCILSIGFFLVFVFAPLVLLFLYPLRLFQRCLSKSRLRSYTLHTFVDTFQGHYKDGTEPGTSDCRWFAAVYFLGRIIILHAIFGITQDVLCYGLTGISILLIVLVTAMFQPYKSINVNNYHISIQLVLAIACFLIAILDQASIKDHWLLPLVVFLIGTIITLPILIIVVYIAYKIFCKIRPVLQLFPKMLGNAQELAYSENEHLNMKVFKTYQSVET